ncbi:hypothetical protein CPC08DRAFT_118884 [Agrocybe pediades]|nr:hypothetical protein CPC08DRAFT_118884 [Agrocybe pediades]
MFMSILTLCALAGPPISGAINAGRGDSRSWGTSQGRAVLVGMMLMATSRYLILGQILDGLWILFDRSHAY